MSMSEIAQLIEQGESETLEFKTSTAQLKGALETVCAFLNGQGGTVLVGVNDKGRCIGQTVTDNTRQEIARECSKLEPPAPVEAEYFPLADSKQILVLRVPAGKHAPYVYDGRPFERVQSITRRMSQQRYDQLVANRQQLNYAWESFASDYAGAHLDPERIDEVVRHAVENKRLPHSSLKQSALEVLERLKLLKNNRVLNGAVALFGKTFLPDCPQCQLKLARFKGTDRHEFLDSDRLYGNAFELLEAGMAFVQKHLPLAAKIVPGQLQRVETPLIPYTAIRESLINALAHRDYSVRSGSIGLAIYDDRMEIFNHGGLQPGVSLGMIKKGHSDPRNPLMAEVFYKMGLIEKWGRGIHEIMASCLEAGDPEPVFNVENPAVFTITFPFPHRLRNIVVVDYSIEELAQSTGINKPVLEQLNNRQRHILVLLHANQEMTIKQIVEKLERPPTERMIRKDLLHLKAVGLAQNQGKTKSVRWSLIRK